MPSVFSGMGSLSFEVKLIEPLFIDRVYCMMMRLAARTPTGLSIEEIARQALSQGELSPGAEAAINRAFEQGRMTAQDMRILEILRDAIATNCIKRIASQDL